MMVRYMGSPEQVLLFVQRDLRIENIYHLQTTNTELVPVPFLFFFF